MAASIYLILRQLHSTNKPLLLICINLPGKKMKTKEMAMLLVF